MAKPIRSVADLPVEIPKKPAQSETKPPNVLTCEQVLKIETPSGRMLFDGYPLPASGASLKVGAPKSGKTLLAVQESIAVASGKDLFGWYKVLQPGPVMIVEQDDPGGAASIRDILKASNVTADLPLFVTPRLPFSFGLQLLDWLEEQIRQRELRMIVLDSYTALRGPRGGGVDIVKVEHTELTQLDDLAKRVGSSIVVIHHGSKGAATLDWTQEAAGTYVMGAAIEAQIHLSRFRELDNAAPERLLRMRGRHSEDVQMTLRFQKTTLDFERVLEGSAAPLYPLIDQIRVSMGTKPFSPKELCLATGVSKATAHRHLDRLSQADVLKKKGYGEYVLAP